MEVFIFLLFFIVILFYVFYSPENNKNKFFYCLSIGILLFFISACRSENCGLMDTKSVYMHEFYKIQTKTMSYIISNYKDALFYVLAKIYTFFSTNVRVWLALINIPLIYTVTKLIYKESKNYMLSFIMFVSLGFYTLCSFTVLRHAIALALTMLAYFEIEKQNLKKFILYVLLASCFHQTAIIFIFAYWISKINLVDRKYFILFVSFVSSILFKEVFLNLILDISETGRYTYFYNNRTGLTYTYFIISTIILVVSDCLSTKAYKKTVEYIKISRLVTIGCALTSFMTILGEFNRLSMFYLIYEIVLLPNAILSKIENKNTRNNTVIIIGISFVLSLYLINYGLRNAGLLDFTFFWELTK